MKYISGLLVMLLAAQANAQGKWYQFTGVVQTIDDRTEEQLLVQHYAKDIVNYVVYIDPDVKGDWTSGHIRQAPRENYHNENSYEYNIYADYRCGDAINIEYYGHSYNMGQVKKSNSNESTRLNVSKRLDIDTQELIQHWHLGMVATAKDSYRLKSSRDFRSRVTTNLTLTGIYDDSPCHKR